MRSTIVLLYYLLALFCAVKLARSHQGGCYGGDSVYECQKKSTPKTSTDPADMGQMLLLCDKLTVGSDLCIKFTDIIRAHDGWTSSNSANALKLVNEKNNIVLAAAMAHFAGGDMWTLLLADPMREQFKTLDLIDDILRNYPSIKRLRRWIEEYLEWAKSVSASTIEKCPYRKIKPILNIFADLEENLEHRKKYFDPDVRQFELKRDVSSTIYYLFCSSEDMNEEQQKAFFGFVTRIGKSGILDSELTSSWSLPNVIDLLKENSSLPVNGWLERMIRGAIDIKYSFTSFTSYLTTLKETHRQKSKLVVAITSSCCVLEAIKDLSNRENISNMSTTITENLPDLLTNSHHVLAPTDSLDDEMDKVKYSLKKCSGGNKIDYKCVIDTFKCNWIEEIKLLKN